MATELSRQVGRRIRQRRLEMGLNQRRLADRIKSDAVDGQRISDWERGVNQPSERYLRMLSEVMEREVAWFYEKESATPDVLGAVAAETSQLDRIETMVRLLLTEAGIADPFAPVTPLAEAAQAGRDLRVRQARARNNAESHEGT